MKIGIQSIPKGISKKWIEYCVENNIEYKLINPYTNDAVQQLEDCDAYMWHHDHLSKKDHQVAKRLLTAIEHSGKVCFPSIYENWHYDDKVAQKYLFEAIDAPLIPSYVFYEEKEALEWVKNTDWPKVFKLTGGAGSSNVKLIKNENEAKKIIRKSFGKGHSIFNQRKYFWDERLSKFKKNKSIIFLLKTFYHLLKPTNNKLVDYIEKDYVYFQDFMPNNEFDLRLTVINQNKIVCIKRYNRKGDFRASGSGNMHFLSKDELDKSLLKMVLETTIKLKMNFACYDLVFDSLNNPVIVEIAYTPAPEYEESPGYWDENLNWQEGVVGDYAGWMVDNVIDQVKFRNNSNLL